MDPKKIECILTWPTPKNIGSLQKLVGFLNYNKDWKKSFSEIIEPFYTLLRGKYLKGSQRIEWAKEQETSFLITEKKLLTSAPV